VISSSGAIVREISHSLGTPLAGIRANVDVLLTNSPNDPAALQASLGRIKTAVDLCQAFLLAYRQLDRISQASGLPDDEPLETAIVKAVELYAAGHSSTTVTADVDLPQVLPGYSSYQVLAILLPLIENAVEAAADGVVHVTHDVIDGYEVLSVTNAWNIPLAANIGDDGMTTKTGHQGLGLGVSRRLSESIGGSLSWVSTHGRASFDVRLPSKAAT
jgi:signal transduction histidine kinase